MNVLTCCRIVRHFPLFLLILALFSSGCKSVFYAEFLTPAPVAAPSHIKSVWILNTHADPLSGNACDGFANHSLNQSRLQVNNTPLDSIEQLALDSALRAQQWDSVQKWLGDHPIDGIIWLKSASTDTASSIVAVDQNGSATYKVHTLGRMWGTWTVVDLENKEFASTCNLFTDSSDFLNPPPYHYSQGLEQEKMNVWKGAAFKNGRLYAQKLQPSWQVKKRFLFVRTSRNMRYGFRYAQRGDWTNAAQYWAKEVDRLKGKRKNRSGTACFNLAVAYEMLGDLEQSIDYAQKSHFEFLNEEAGEYILQLRRRTMDSYYVRTQLEAK